MPYKYRAENMGALGFCADDGMIEEKLEVEGMMTLGARVVKVVLWGEIYEVRRDKHGDNVLHVRRVD